MGAIFTAYKNRTPMLITAGQQSRSILPFDPSWPRYAPPNCPGPMSMAVEPARAEDVRWPSPAPTTCDDAAARPGAGVGAGRRLGYAGFSRGAAARGFRAASRPGTAGRDRRRARRRARAGLRGPAPRSTRRRLDQAVQLAERHQARVFIAPMAGTCGFPGDHALFAGHLSPMRERIRRHARRARRVLALGAPAFTYHVAGDATACAAAHASVGQADR